MLFKEMFIDDRWRPYGRRPITEAHLEPLAHASLLLDVRNPDIKTSKIMVLEVTIPITLIFAQSKLVPLNRGFLCLSVYTCVHWSDFGSFSYNQYTVELRWLELVGTVGASSTHPCVRAIPSLTIFKLVHVHSMSSWTPRFYRPKLQSASDQWPFAR